MLWAWYKKWNGKLRLVCVNARQSVIHLQRFMQMYWTCWWSNSHKWLPLWKALSVEELETLPVGTKPRTSQHWLPGSKGMERVSTQQSAERMRKGYHQADRHWNCFKGNVGEMSYRWSGMRKGFTKHIVPFWIELNCRDVTLLWDTEGWSPGPKINSMVLDFSLAPHRAGKLKEAQTVLTAINGTVLLNTTYE